MYSNSGGRRLPPRDTRDRDRERGGDRDRVRDSGRPSRPQEGRDPRDSRDFDRRVAPRDDRDREPFRRDPRRDQGNEQRPQRYEERRDPRSGRDDSRRDPRFNRDDNDGQRDSFQRSGPRDFDRNQNQGGGFGRDFNRNQSNGNGFNRDNNRNQQSGNGFNRDNNRNQQSGNGFNRDNNRGGFDSRKPQGQDYRRDFQRGPGPRQDDRRRDTQYQGGYDNRSRDNRGGDDSYRAREFKKDDEPKEKKIERIKKLLEALESSLTVDKLEVVNSKWDARPKGFEAISSERAKLSGLFPLPGYPRPIDYTKLEGALKDRVENGDAHDILFSQTKIESLDSRNSRRLIVSGIDFENIDYLKIVDYINKFLYSVDIPEASLQNIEFSKKTKDERFLIVEFKTAGLTTVALALDGRKVTDTECILQLKRPSGYLSSPLTAIQATAEYPEEIVPDSSFKIMLTNIPSSVTESQLIDALGEINKVRGAQLLRERGTKDSVGIAFVQFEDLASTLALLQKANNLKLEESTISASLSCDGAKQEVEVTFDTLPFLASGKHVMEHKKTKVIQLINCVTPKDLISDYDYEAIKEDIITECTKFGKVADVKIPRPPRDYTPGIDQFLEPGVGKVFVRFSQLEGSTRGLMGLAGRKFSERTVVAAFFNEDDYELNLF